MKGFLAWMWISRPDKTLLITRKTFLIIRSDAGGLRPPYIINIYNISIYIYFMGVRMTRNQVAEVNKKIDFSKVVHRSRRELSNALIESFWEAVLVEIRPF